MAWHEELLDRIEAAGPCGYFDRAEAASEPTALAGLALSAAGRDEAAIAHGDWLAAQQTRDGAVGVTSSHQSPCWPTSLAMLLWQRLDDEARYGTALERALDWTLAEHGLTFPRQAIFGHDTTLVGWSWAAQTHSWQEPTAMFVLALKAVGQSQHPRTREAVQMLVDRLLPTGGCNYGNTIVLGQELLPHIEPTGMIMLALADEQIADPRIGLSLDYLERALDARYRHRITQLRPDGPRRPSAAHLNKPVGLSPSTTAPSNAARAPSNSRSSHSRPPTRPHCNPTSKARARRKGAKHAKQIDLNDCLSFAILAPLRLCAKSVARQVESVWNNQPPKTRKDRKSIAVRCSSRAASLRPGWLAGPWDPRVDAHRAPASSSRTIRSTTARSRRQSATACSPAGAKPETFRGKRVLLKPNMVEPSRKISHMTTHPAVIVAAAEVFRGWGATGPHRRSAGPRPRHRDGPASSRAVVDADQRRRRPRLPISTTKPSPGSRTAAGAASSPASGSRKASSRPISSSRCRR